MSGEIATNILNSIRKVKTLLLSSLAVEQVKRAELQSSGVQVGKNMRLQNGKLAKSDS